MTGTTTNGEAMLMVRGSFERFHSFRALFADARLGIFLREMPTSDNGFRAPLLWNRFRAFRIAEVSG
jgi:hypothetical protein